ncbi:site-specific integrase [Parapedobacter soli]|uniref:site-specific integrase n=1 Tax=Parapedobacter soli TaxID=416955 RepID=UPI0021C8804B|nr:site-specific integrase [Parapedobacter soli]
MALKTTFELRRDTANKKGEHPVTLIVWVAGNRRKLSTGITLLPEQWDSENQQAVYINRKEAKRLLPNMNPDTLPYNDDINRINKELRSIADEVSDIATKFEIDRIAYTVEDVISEFKTRRKPQAQKVDPKHYLVDFIDQYVNDVRATRNEGTVKVYITTRNHIDDYEKHKRQRITMESAGYGFLQAFYNYLIEEKGQINVTAAKQITTVKTFLSFARKHGHTINQTYHDFTVKRETLEVIALTENEFLTLYNLDLTGDGKVLIQSEPKALYISLNALAKVRDVFCFSCVTGLRYSDLAQLRREHIKNGYIRLTVTKTKEPIEIPLTAYAAEILAKYPNRIKILPVISSQKFNAYLKALCRYAGINEEIEIVRYKGAKRYAVVYPKYELISAHTGRKTFATLSLEKGLNAEEVMSITGHKSYASFKRYVKVTQERKKAVMVKAWGAPETMKKVD